MTRQTQAISLAAGLAVLGLAALWMSGSADSGKKPEVGPDAAVARPIATGTLPAFDEVAATVVDAGPKPDGPLAVDTVRISGLFGRPASFIDEIFSGPEGVPPWWTRVPNLPSPTFKNKRGIVVSLKVDGDRVVGAKLKFPKDASTADLPTVSPQLVGGNTALAPQGFEMADPKRGLHQEGKFETAGGIEVWYRGDVDRNSGPAKPVWFEYQTTEFAD